MGHCLYVTDVHNSLSLVGCGYMTGAWYKEQTKAPTVPLVSQEIQAKLNLRVLFHGSLPNIK